MTHQQSSQLLWQGQGFSSEKEPTAVCQVQQSPAMHASVTTGLTGQSLSSLQLSGVHEHQQQTPCGYSLRLLAIELCFWNLLQMTALLNTPSQPNISQTIKDVCLLILSLPLFTTIARDSLGAFCCLTPGRMSHKLGLTALRSASSEPGRTKACESSHPPLNTSSMPCWGTSSRGCQMYQPQSLSNGLDNSAKPLWTAFCTHMHIFPASKGKGEGTDPFLGMLSPV